MRLRVIDARAMARLLVSLGFKRVRQPGSHVVYRPPEGRWTTVPHHPGRDLARPLIRQIPREIDLSVAEYTHRLGSL